MLRPACLLPAARLSPPDVLSMPRSGTEVSLRYLGPATRRTDAFRDGTLTRWKSAVWNRRSDRVSGSAADSVTTHHDAQHGRAKLQSAPHRALVAVTAGPASAAPPAASCRTERSWQELVQRGRLAPVEALHAQLFLSGEGIAAYKRLLRLAAVFSVEAASFSRGAALREIARELVAARILTVLDGSPAGHALRK